MEARIVVANRKRGIYAAQTEDGEFVIIELIDTSEPEIGDVISHPDFTSMGSETYKNITQGCAIDVFVQNICGNLGQARKQCFL
jgi:hypothetical protein